MTKQLRGPAHFNWKGGSKSYYRTLRPDIIVRDSERCFFCHTTNRQLEIHHFDGNHDNHALDNLRLTCRSCHNKVHGKIKNIGNYKSPRKLSDAKCDVCQKMFRPRNYRSRFCSMICKNLEQSQRMKAYAAVKQRNSFGQFATAFHQPAL